MDIIIEINKLKKVAKENGLEVRFHDHRTNMGDFCIFIYDKSVRKSHIVGYDGLWEIVEHSRLSFKSCLEKAYNWIEKRDKRYIKSNGRWWYIGYEC
jgi:hypothetical protein